MAEWFLVELRTTIYVSRRTFSVTFFWKISFLFWFSDFEQKTCKTSRKAFGNFCRNDILVSRRTNWEDKCFMENADFSYQFRTLSNNLIQLLTKVVSASLPKMTFARLENFFEENNFLKTFREVTCFWIWAKNVWQDGQAAFTCPVEQCWKAEPFGEKQIFLTFPHIM